MGVPHLVEEPIVFIGALFSDKTVFDQVLPLLQDKFGNILFQSDIQPWKYSNHYNEELGSRIFRNFIFFDGIIDPSALADIKLLTNDIETIYSQDGKRRSKS